MDEYVMLVAENSISFLTLNWSIEMFQSMISKKIHFGIKTIRGIQKLIYLPKRIMHIAANVPSGTRAVNNECVNNNELYID